MGYRFLLIFGALLLLLSGFFLNSPKYITVESDNPNKLAPIQKAYLLGDKSELTKKQINTHKNLGIMHFMTPSGLHLSSLLFIITLLIRKKSINFWVSLTLLFLLNDFTHLDSFKRMCFFTILRKNPLYALGNKKSFLLTFSFYFIKGQYIENPLSYSLSFLFLGILIFSKDRKEMFYSILLVQMMITIYFNNGYYLLGSIYGLVLTLSSFIIFPLILTEALLSLQYFTNTWITLIEFLNIIKGPAIPTFLFFIATTLFLFKSHHKLKILCLIISTFLPIGLLTPTKKFYYTSPPPINYISMREVKNKVVLKYDNGLTCKSKLKIDHWHTYCFK
jgi:hypothetical protein